MDVWDFRFEISAIRLFCTVNCDANLDFLLHLNPADSLSLLTSVLHTGDVHPYIHRKVLLKLKKNVKKNLKFLPLSVKKTALFIHCKHSLIPDKSVFPPNITHLSNNYNPPNSESRPSDIDCQLSYFPGDKGHYRSCSTGELKHCSPQNVEEK